MTIDWHHFTPYASLFGGVLIGISAAILVLIEGRILGISGILSGVLHPKERDFAWRVSFLTGILATPLILWLVLSDWPMSEVATPWHLLVLAGILVGYGTRMGSGCTSGHGVCGLSRLSKRSLVSTCIFMGTGFLTVLIVRHLLG